MDNRRCFRNGRTGGEFSCIAVLGGDGGPADCLDRHGGGARTGTGGACAIRARITIAGNRMPGAPDSAGARIHDV